MTDHPSAPTFSIRAKNLAKRFNREWIFRRLNLDILPATTYAIVGPNGSGKSTLLQVLWGQLPPTSGELHFSKDNHNLLADDVYQHVVIATPYMDLIDEFTLSEQLNFHFKIRKSRGLTVDEMIERMYLTQARDKQISNFSSGMRQRVKLALAFFTDADMIFLDEPGTNLDRRAFEWYLSELHSLPKDVAVLIASNEPSEYPSDAQKIEIMAYK